MLTLIANAASADAINMPVLLHDFPLFVRGVEDCLLSWLERRPPGRETCPLCNQHVDARRVGRPSRIVCNLLGELSRRCDFARPENDSNPGSGGIRNSSNVDSSRSSHNDDDGGGCPWVGTLDAHASHVKQCRYASRSVLLSRLAAQDLVVADLRREIGRLKVELKYPPLNTAAAAADTGAYEHSAASSAILRENEGLRDEVARLNHLLHACQGRDEMVHENLFDRRYSSSNASRTSARAATASAVGVVPTRMGNETLSPPHDSAAPGTLFGSSASRRSEHSNAPVGGRYSGGLSDQSHLMSNSVGQHNTSEMQHNRSGGEISHVYTSFNSFSESSSPRRAESKRDSPLRTRAEAETSAKDACIYESINNSGSSTRSQSGVIRGWVAGGGGADSTRSTRHGLYRKDSTECRNDESSDSDGDIEVAADDDGRSNFDNDQRRHNSEGSSEQRRQRRYRREGGTAAVSSVPPPASVPAVEDSGMTDLRRLAAIQRAQARHRQRLEEAQAEGRILPDFSDDDGPLSGESSLAGDCLADGSNSISCGSSATGGVSLSRSSLRAQVESKEDDNDDEDLSGSRLPSTRHSTSTSDGSPAVTGPVAPLSRSASGLASSLSPRLSL